MVSVALKITCSQIQRHHFSGAPRTTHKTTTPYRLIKTSHLPNAASSGSAPLEPESTPPIQPDNNRFWAWWKSQQTKTTNLQTKLASLGLAAVLAYGLFDGVSYTIAFTIAFLGYEAKTGLNPAQNPVDIVKIVVLMWAGNNVTRPFRLAGAAALAPFMDNLMNKLQEKWKLPNKLAAFIILTAAVATPCLAVVAGLFISRLVF